MAFPASRIGFALGLIRSPPSLPLRLVYHLNTCWRENVNLPGGYPKSARCRVLDECTGLSDPESSKLLWTKQCNTSVWSLLLSSMITHDVAVTSSLLTMYIDRCHWNELNTSLIRSTVIMPNENVFASFNSIGTISQNKISVSSIYTSRWDSFMI